MNASVKMLSVREWLERAEAEMSAPVTQNVLAGFDSDRAKAEAIVSMIAAGLAPYQNCETDPNFGLRIGKVLFMIEKSIFQFQSPTAVLREYDAEIAGFYRAVSFH